MNVHLNEQQHRPEGRRSMVGESHGYCSNWPEDRDARAWDRAGVPSMDCCEKGNCVGSHHPKDVPHEVPLQIQNVP